MLEVKNLKASIAGKEILTGLNLSVNAGEVHAIMGPNGSGKSTLAQVIAGHADYEVTGGTVEFLGKDLLDLEPEERAREGIFLGFQYPVEIPGVNNAYLLKAAVNAKRKHHGMDEIDAFEFLKLAREKMAMLDMDPVFLNRGVNEGFSGGEKKRNEILQMAMLEPNLAILDETDSGLDIDALKAVANGVNSLRDPDRAIVLVTHYQRLLDYIEPDYVHVLSRGRIIRSGDKSLALELEDRGYEWVRGGRERMSATAIDQAMLLAAVEAMPGDELADARRAAAIRFASLGFPTVGQEDWKYTSLSGAAKLGNEWLDAFVANGEPDVCSKTDDLVASVQDTIDAYWIVLRDGYVDTKLPEIDGVSFSRIAGEGHRLLESADAMSAFNAALLRDGLLIVAKPNAVPDKPIGILAIDNPANVMTQTRVIIDAAEHSHLRIVECSLSMEAGRQFTNSIFEANLADGARLDHVRIQNRDVNHVGVNKVSTKLKRSASFSHNSFDLGGALTRNDVSADIAGEGATVNLNGLYLAAGDQHIDNHTSIVHGVGPSTSKEEYRGILSGKSRCVFNGKVIVSPGADGTDSRQSNHNLLLSERAEIDTKPELEIYADDVKCAHGATVGQLDETALFYLRSRGLALDHARRIITRAFAAGTLSTLAVAECHDYLAEVLDQRLANLIDEKQ